MKTRIILLFLASIDTLLEKDAYMFCHHGQGILYIENSGQHLPGVGFEPEIEDLREYYANDPRNFNRYISQIETIIRHHTACPNDELGSNEEDAQVSRVAESIFSGSDWDDGILGYHELILRDGTVQILHDTEMYTKGVERGDLSTRTNNRVAYHISLVGIGPMYPNTGQRIIGSEEQREGYPLTTHHIWDGHPFTTAQELAFRARVLHNIEYFNSKGANITIDDVKGHLDVEPAGVPCPGMSMAEVRDWITNGVPVETIRDWRERWDWYINNWNDWLRTLRTWRS